MQVMASEQVYYVRNLVKKICVSLIHNGNEQKKLQMNWPWAPDLRHKKNTF